MPTNNIKHLMLVEARKIANTEFKITSRILPKEKDGLLVTVYNNAAMNKELAISRILNNHPEFDEDRFRQMIKTFEVRNKEKEFEE